MTVCEIKTFLAINLIMGIKRYPSYRDHWSTNPILHDPYVSQLMFVNRFGWILSHLHLNDNSVMPSRDSSHYDKLYKVRPLIELIQKNH